MLGSSSRACKSQGRPALTASAGPCRRPPTNAGRPRWRGTATLPLLAAEPNSLGHLDTATRFTAGGSAEQKPGREGRVRQRGSMRARARAAGATAAAGSSSSSSSHNVAACRHELLRVSDAADGPAHLCRSRADITCGSGGMLRPTRRRQGPLMCCGRLAVPAHLTCMPRGDLEESWGPVSAAAT